ncbi:unnamed protein product [Blepharisma stoltei]|uniref:Tetratricopeptide repeat protein n=1 Tax=Blepharisma stoltei TaxID=1481888 RepID=A0AAU9IJI6_9CILI|nr:unnamed protein product [Blepharisma stoltei]
MESILTSIQYFARQGFYHHIIETCEGEMRRGQDTTLAFWRAFGIFKEGSVTEAIRELDNLMQRRDIQYPACCAIIYYHKQCKLVDQEAVMRFKNQKSTFKSSAGDASLLMAGQFMSLIGKNNKSRQHVTEVLDRNSGNLQALNVYGWNELLTEQDGDIQSASRAFDQVIEESGELVYTRYIDALLGKVKCYETAKKFKEIVEILNDMLVKNPKFVPVLLEKAKVQMMIGDWDEIVETVQRILVASNRNIEALRIWTFHALAREASFDVAVEKLKELHAALVQKEPKNPHLYIEFIKPIARIAGRKQAILEQTLSIAQEARRLKPDSSEVLLELGEQLRLLGDYNAAIQTFTEASQKDEANIQAINKIIHCKILQGHYTDAAQQMEFLFEIEEANGRSAEVTFIASLLAWKKDQDKKEAIRLLDEALSLHVAASKQLSPGFEFYTKLNPDFLVEIAKEYLQYLGLKPLPKTGKPPHYLVRGAKLLETITKQIPGIIEGHLMLAKAKYISNDNQAAQRYIQIALQLDPDCIDALIINALINLQSSQYLAASASLEQALARNFMIRENPMFMLVKGTVEMKQGKYADALKTFEAGINLPGVRSPAPPNKKSQLFLTLSEEDRAIIYANLAICYAENKKLPEASRIMAEAIGEFAGTSAEVIVVIANSEISLKKGDLKQALNILNGILPENPQYKEAKVAQADIYLNNMQNRRLYAKCYYDIVTQEESVENYLLLGEALMRIQEPEEAIKVYEKALRQKPDDLFLTKEIGRALVLTHDYQRAIQYYESASRADPRKSELLTDLARLYLRLKDYHSANLVLEQALKAPVNDINSMRQAAQNYLLQARVFLKSTTNEDPLNLQPLPSAANALENAKTLQTDLLASARDMAPDQVNIERSTCADILFQLGQYYELREKKLDQALNCYLESLNHNEMNEKAIISIAYLYESQGDAQKCMQFCQRMLRINPGNEEASELMAELLLQQNSIDEALVCYQRLLENKTDQYKILSKLLNMLRRAGRIDAFQDFLKNAEKIKGRNADAGLAYCKGLFYKYSGKMKEALEELNKARNDAVFGQPSLELMIKLYLNPNDEAMWSPGRIASESVNAAESLVKELIIKSYSLKAATLEAFVSIAKGQRDTIEKAFQSLSEILQANNFYVPAIIIYSLGKCAANRQEDAKHQLRSLAKIPYHAEFAEDFEKGWLMLAEIYIDSNNLDLSQDLLQRCLRYNQSCSRAMELLGLIKEREGNYKESSNFYESAWRLSKSSSIGFRLAFNYLKARRFVDAIDVSKEVLKLFPDYPRIKQEILDKARESLRP